MEIYQDPGTTTGIPPTLDIGHPSSGSRSYMNINYDSMKNMIIGHLRPTKTIIDHFGYRVFIFLNIYG